MIVLWVILALLVILFLLHYGVDAGYRDGVFFLRVKAGPLRFTLLPKKEKNGGEKKKRREKKKDESPADSGAQEEKPSEEGKSRKSFLPKAGISDWIELAKKALKALGRIFRSFHVDYLQLHCTVATKDPYDTATTYGYLCAAVEALLDEKSGVLRVRKRDIRLDMDFLSETMAAEGEIVISAALWRLVGAALILGVQFLRWRSALKKKEKLEVKADQERTEDNGREQNQ